MKNFNISEQLSDWGGKEPRLPANNDALKQRILETVKPSPASYSTPARRPFLFNFLVVAASAACILLMMANPRLFKNPSGYQTTVRNFDSSSGVMETQELGLSYGENVGLGSREVSFVQKAADMIAPESMPLDTREFMDTEYYATINSRDVYDDSEKTLTILRGNGARIDSANQSTKYARISFAMPQSSLEKMIDELKELAPGKFYVESTQSENLLKQKQSIEEEQKSAEQELERLEDQRQDIIDSYTQDINMWKDALDSANRKIESINKEKASTFEPGKVELLNLEFTKEHAAKLKAESKIRMFESQYEIDLEAADRRISEQQATIQRLGEEDTALVQKTEIVTGTISLQWISVWGILNLYLPVRPILITLIIIGAWFLLARRRQAPVVLP